MMRRRAGPPSEEAEDDSSSDEDVFSKLSQTQNKKKRKDPPSTTATVASSSQAKAAAAPPASNINPKLPLTTTSSMKRHHKEMSDSRKSKMDALLQELEQVDAKPPPTRVPHKKGSFVEPGQEHTTTNLFVGNLAPTLTEEEVTDLFRQFGDLYSVKVMWPRTSEDRARNRLTGFVCFMNRADAEQALECCHEADPFNVGRRLNIGWGKNVLKKVRYGPDGRPVAPIPQKKARSSSYLSTGSSHSHSSAHPTSQPVYDPRRHGASAIHVQIPSNPERARFITAVASFVAKDGSGLEDLLWQKEQRNPAYQFLRMPHASSNQHDKVRQEHVYYRWRVFSLAAGDGLFQWRPEPFCMFQPYGCFWIPPPMDPNAAHQERELQRQQEALLERQQKERRFVTGRQLERGRRGGPDGSRLLTPAERADFETLVGQKLNLSRESICQAMAFCFEKSGAARQISDLLRDLLLESTAAVDTRVARLYLISDILFNSQQPGVRNAFLYRDAIERNAPEIFASFGRGSSEALGRISQNKLATAVSRVLSAWTQWSVYTPMFIDQLQDCFQGKEVVVTETGNEESKLPKDDELEDSETPDVIPANDAQLVSTARKGEWTEVSHEEEQKALRNAKSIKLAEKSKGVVDNEAEESSIEQTKLSKDIDGEAVEDDADGEPIGEDVDGEPIGEDEDADGEPIEEDDVDGEPIMDEDADGEPLDEDADGEPIDDELDGEPL